MYRTSGRSLRVFVSAFLSLMAFAALAPVAAAAVCPPPEAKMESVHGILRQGETARPIELEDRIAVKVAGLAELRKCAEKDGKSIVLFLDSRPFPTLSPYSVSSDGTTLFYELLVHRVEGSELDPWNKIFGKPGLGVRSVDVSVGIDGGDAIKSDITMIVDPLPDTLFYVWIALFIGLAGIFLAFARRSTILRNGITDPDAPTSVGTYSLARSQAAFWFFFVLASYLLIGLATGDYVSSLNGTALGLIAIGGGTAVIGGMIDSSGDQNVQEDQRIQALNTKKTELVTLKDEIANGINGVALTDAQKTQWRLKQSSVESQISKLRGESEGFLRDILSDANGVGFHRFQMVAWTVVLGIIFVVAVWRELAMPTFDATLLGLMGLSAGTYLGLKTTEATTPG